MVGKIVTGSDVIGLNAVGGIGGPKKGGVSSLDERHWVNRRRSIEIDLDGQEQHPNRADHDLVAVQPSS